MNHLLVGIAEMKFAVAPQILVTYGLGSCVAIVLHSQEVGVGCMAHVMLPNAHRNQEGTMPAKFADSAVWTMVSQMGERGVETSRIVAKIAGGRICLPGAMEGQAVVWVQGTFSRSKSPWMRSVYAWRHRMSAVMRAKLWNILLKRGVLWYGRCNGV